MTDQSGLSRIASITRLRLRGLRFFLPFLWHARRSLAQARPAPGCISVDVRMHGWLTFWTLTVWADEPSMLAYRDAGDHRRAMPKLRTWCSEAATARWPIKEPTPQQNSMLWKEGEQRLALTGRLHHVDHPSKRQAAGRLPSAS